MLSYCLKCRKNAPKDNLLVLKTKNRRILLSSNCAVFVAKFKGTNGLSLGDNSTFQGVFS